MTMRPISAPQAESTVAAQPSRTRGRISAFFSRPETAVLLLVPVALYVWFVHEFGVNAIYYDQWDNVALLTHSNLGFTTYAGHTSLGMLWTQHNENRMLFPNLVVLALRDLTHFNVLIEVYLSAVLLVIATSLIILAHRRDLVFMRWAVYLPVAFLMLSLGQFGDTLFGFQLAWYLILLALAAAIFFLDSPRLSWFGLLAAIAMAVVGSYSSFEGILIWPAGLVVLLLRHRPRAFLLTWLASAILTTFVYFYHFHFYGTGSGGSGYLFAHPWSVIEFFLFNVGDILGKPIAQSPGASDPLIVVMGGTVVLLAAVALIAYGRSARPSKSPVGPALICFGVLFAVTVTLGRSHLGLSAASQSRYATFNLLILAGSYLCLLERWPTSQTDDAKMAAGEVGAIGHVVGVPGRRAQGSSGQRVLEGLRLLAFVLIIWVVISGAENGIDAGRGWRQVQQRAALVATHAEDAPNTLITSALFPNQSIGADNIRSLAEAAKDNGLSFFATSEGARLAHVKLPETHQSVHLVTRVGKPTSGAVLRGLVYVVATASGSYHINSVEFEIKGSGGSQVLHGGRFLYGYLGEWNSKDSANGIYTVQSVAHDATGHVSTSRAVRVTVKNDTTR
jgi:hypothetical protein